MAAAVAIIPARYASRRLPRKPLADLGGLPLVVRVCQVAERAQRVARVVVATDHAAIQEAVAHHGFEAVMTPATCRSGTDRVAEAARGLDAELIVNLQGDEPFIDPADLDRLVEAAAEHPDGVSTLVRPLDDLDRFLDPSVVKVVAVGARAAWFSRAPIPYGAEPGDPDRSPLEHVGVYAYGRATLEHFHQLPEGMYEKSERLEQLRALEHGMNVWVFEARAEGLSFGIDTPEDLLRAREEISRGTGSRGVDVSQQA